MQVQEAFAVRKVEGAMRQSVGIMKNINSLVRLPELTGTMRELSQELMKAGIIEEMITDSMPDSELLEDDEEDPESEVNKVLSEILQDKKKVTASPVEQAPAAPVTMEEEEEDEDAEAMLDQMRGRLEALKS
jgi:charged multivesicular body protein 3